MSGLLPTTTDATTDRSGSPALLCLEDDRTDEILDALSSDTARAIFRALNERPRSAAALADHLEMSIQRVSYHLDTLTEIGLIEVADTCYSEKGREMDVYAVAEEPLVIFLGSENDQPGLRIALKNLAVAVGPVSILIAIWETLARFVGSDGAA
ncbi:ArsR/SmtB family transcription factor [Natrarchaeobaculum aegyptiacum]|uniref:Transcriptional regulator n=1 Tax=Natrarchaeobaculum aegyptiacum TaxID=745377 RepID=A0A2Z2HPX3_9EURY|nr:helix-turn-helix domain-containing protein [Natrarchaeobaculum aegyptiacum]ARS89071.1 transcriptional regulator [Natrarchaeobaculum aegyptiacum]